MVRHEPPARPRPQPRQHHLKGYDAAKAPRFAWPERVTRAFKEHQKPKRIEHERQTVEGWTVHVDTRLLGPEKDVGGPALKILAAKLYGITLVVPEAAPSFSTSTTASAPCSTIPRPAG